MQTISIRRKSDGEILAWVQSYFPTVTSLTREADGSFTVVSSEDLYDGAIADLISMLPFGRAWEGVVL